MVFNITKFSEDLLSSLDNLKSWPNKVKIMQKNWIGKSFGCEIDFKIEGHENENSVKILPLDQIHYLDVLLALSVDHPLAKKYENNKEFNNFKEECSKTGTTEEALAQAEKLGFKTDMMAINPLNPKNKVPVYFANFVLMDYGFGAIFGCLLMINVILILLLNTT